MFAAPGSSTGVYDTISDSFTPEDVSGQGFFPVWWQFDNFFALLKIRNPRQRREGTSS